MKTILYYFSGTGNSLQVAREIAAKLSGSELLSIPAVMKSDTIPEADIIGIVFPPYMFGIPLVIERFCRRLRAGADPYIFGVATGGMPGAALLQLKRILGQRGLPLAAGFIVKMPDNYTPLAGPPSPARQERMFAKARLKAGEIAAAVKARLKKSPEANNPLFNFFFSTLLYRRCSPHIVHMDHYFRTTDQCNGCGLCEKLCPVENIRMQVGHPMWLHHCEQCLSCLHWCPQEAIQLGRQTEKRKRYHHPEVKVQDLCYRQ